MILSTLLLSQTKTKTDYPSSKYIKTKFHHYTATTDMAKSQQQRIYYWRRP